jgi:uncharacterized cupin superfamily protein
VPNLYEPDWETTEREGLVYRRARLGRHAGSERLGASLYEVPPGGSVWPYHWHLANEELLFVLDGRPTLRTPEGRRELSRGDVVAFRTGEGGAHQLENETADDVRFLMISTMNGPEVAVYPDSDKVGLMEKPPGAPDEGTLEGIFRFSDRVDYWEGE